MISGRFFISIVFLFLNFLNSNPLDLTHWFLTFSFLAALSFTKFYKKGYNALIIKNTKCYYSRDCHILCSLLQIHSSGETNCKEKIISSFNHLLLLCFLNLLLFTICWFTKYTYFFKVHDLYEHWGSILSKRRGSLVITLRNKID